MDTSLAKQLKDENAAFCDIRDDLCKIADRLALDPFTALTKGELGSPRLSKSLSDFEAGVRVLAARVDRLSRQPLPLPFASLIAAAADKEP